MNKLFNYFNIAYFTSNSFEKQALSTATTNIYIYIYIYIYIMSVASSLHQTLNKPERSD